MVIKYVRAAAIFIMVATCLPAHADPSLQRVVDAKSLQVGIAINPPWIARTPKGELIGYDIDLTKALAADLGVTANFVEMPFADLVPRLAKGDVDIVAAGLAITPERARSVMFSNVTGRAAIRVVASRAALGSDPAKALAAPGFVIGAMAASTDADAARHAFPNAKIVTFDTAGAALSALLNGGTQALAATAPVPRLTATLYDAKFQLLKRPLTYTPEAFALRPDDTRLIGFVNNWIAAKSADGTLGEVRNYWFGRMTWLRKLETVTEPPATTKPATK